LDSEGNNKGIDFVPPHDIDECHIELNISCVVIENDLVTPHNFPCDQTNEIDAGSSAHIADFNCSIEISAPAEITANEIEPCDLLVESDLDHIKLVKNDEVLARICHGNCLFH
jgi:hypothetical protein